MKLIEYIADKLGFTRKYAAAKINRLTSDWTTTTTSANSEVRNDIKILRARTRQLERDNDYCRRYFNLLQNNVLGPEGIRLNSKARDLSGELDVVANRKVEQAWKDWSRPENCTVAGNKSWLDVQRLVLRSVARDGAVIVRKIRNFKNPYRFSLQIVEIDHLDVDYNGKTRAGNLIRMGIELDKYEKPIAYHLLDGHLGDEFGMGRPKKRQRIPADEILLVTLNERPHQVLGVPWLSSAMGSLSMLNGMMQAELVASRTAAAKCGFFTQQADSDGYVGEGFDENHNIISQVEPASLELLPKGVSFQPFDPSHNGDFSNFTKSCLRSIASGLGVSYTSLSSDLEGVNYSSIRAGLLEERSEWRSLQGWFIEHVVDPVFREWLSFALLSDSLQLPATKLSKFESVEWKARRWSWVDPLKDVQSAVLAIDNGLKSRRSIISENGGDVDTVTEEIAQDQLLAELNGLMFGEKESAEPQQSENEQSEPSDSSGPEEAPDNLAVEASQGLNGAQITAALQVIQQIVGGQMPMAAGTELLVSLGLEEATVSKMMSAVQNFKPKPAEEPKNES